MATLTYTDGHVINLTGTTAFEVRIHPGDNKIFHIHAKGSSVQESIWKKNHIQDISRDRNDFTLYVLEQGKNVKIDEVTDRVVPDE